MNVMHNARFYIDGTFDNDILALLVSGGMIKELLKSESDIPRGAERVDLHGGYVYPGFIDAHTHSFSGGLYTNGIDLSGCTCLDDIFSLLHKAGQDINEDVFAWRFDENGIREKRFPTLKELDAVCPNVNLLLRRIDGHSCILNSKARNLIPGLLDQDDVLKAEDNDRAVNWLQDNCDTQTILRAYHAASDIALKGGFTTIHTMVGDAQNSNQHCKLLQEHLQDFAISFEIYPQSFNIEEALELGSKRIGGCILADGSIGSHTAALSSRYHDQNTQGILYHTDEFWSDFITQAHNNNLQICVHCIGDSAIRQINNSYAKLDRDEVASLRHQLIHCELTPDDLIEEIARSGAVPVMQPNFDLLWGGESGLYTQRLGNPRIQQMNRIGSFTKKQVKICGSSDWYVTELNIAMSLWAAINHHNVAECLTPQEAIRIYTENNAWLSGEALIRGRIQPGYMADLSVMQTDFTKPFDYRVAKTIAIYCDGVVKYAAE